MREFCVTRTISCVLFPFLLFGYLAFGYLFVGCSNSYFSGYTLSNFFYCQKKKSKGKMKKTKKFDFSPCMRILYHKELHNKMGVKLEIYVKKK